MRKLKVKNWEKFQHYKDRNPPWIKLHFTIMASEDWVMLADASKLLAVVCMMVASRNEGIVPDNPAYLQRVAYLDKKPNLNPLIECGFLEILQADASKSKQKQANARPETETETDIYSSLRSEYNKQPEKLEKKKSPEMVFRSVLEPHIQEPLLSDLCSHRKAKRAAFTETAALGVLKAADNCGVTPSQAAEIMIDRNWITVKREWLDRDKNNGKPKMMTIAGAAAEALAERQRNEFSNDMEQQQGSGSGYNRPDYTTGRFALPKLPI